MNRFVRSSTYARAKVFMGVLFIGFGIAIFAQVAIGVGLRLEAIPAYVLGLAFIGLGIVRLRAWRAIR